MNDLEFYKRRISELEEECVKKQNEINQLEESCGRMKARVDTYVNYILPRATEEARKMIDNHQYVGIRIATCEEWANQGKDNQFEVEKYRKAFEDAKKERDCQIAEYQKKIEELTAENEKLKGNVGSKGYREKEEKTNNFYGMYACSAKNLIKDDLLMFLGILTNELVKNGIDFRYEMEKELKVWDVKIKSDKEITNFLPEEPIKVANILINAEGEYERNPLAKKICGNDKGTYRIFDIRELRQIEEHLLVYCNHNREAEE